MTKKSKPAFQNGVSATIVSALAHYLLLLPGQILSLTVLSKHQSIIFQHSLRFELLLLLNFHLLSLFIFSFPFSLSLLCFSLPCLSLLAALNILRSATWSRSPEVTRTERERQTTKQVVKKRKTLEFQSNQHITSITLSLLSFLLFTLHSLLARALVASCTHAHMCEHGETPIPLLIT